MQINSDFTQTFVALNYVSKGQVVPNWLASMMYVLNIRPINKLYGCSYIDKIVRYVNVVPKVPMIEAVHIFVFESVCLFVVVRKLQVAILARLSRDISQTVRIDCHSFLSRVLISLRPTLSDDAHRDY